MIECKQIHAADAQLVALLTQLDEYLAQLYPSESNHILDVTTLFSGGVQVFAAFSNAELVGCCALDLRHGDFAELKRMYVQPKLRGKGIAIKLYELAESFACSQGVAMLNLETGIYQAEAIALYKRLGFELTQPFAEYEADPLSIFMTKDLNQRCGQ